MLEGLFFRTVLLERGTWTTSRPLMWVIEFPSMISACCTMFFKNSDERPQFSVSIMIIVVRKNNMDHVGVVPSPNGVVPNRNPSILRILALRTK